MTFLPNNLMRLTCFVTSINYFGGRTPNVWVKKVELICGKKKKNQDQICDEVCCAYLFISCLTSLN